MVATKKKYLDFFFVQIPKALEAVITCIDFWFSKSYGHASRPQGNHLLGINEGHPLIEFVLIFFALLFLIGGLDPILFKIVVAFSSALVLTFVIGWLTNKCENVVPLDSKRSILKYIRDHTLHFVSSLVLVFTSVPILLYTSFSKAPVFFYQHIHIPIILALVGFTYICIGIRRLVFFDPKGYEEFGRRLNNTDLLSDDQSKGDKSRDPVSSSATAWYGLLSGPTYHILKFLLLPAWLIVLLPTEYIKHALWILIPVSWLLLTMCTVHGRLNFVLTVIDRWFLTGGQLIVSLVIIALAIGRIAGISYVATLMDGAPFLHVLFFMTAAYSSLLLFEYWSNSILCSHLLSYLRARKIPKREDLNRVPYCPYHPGVDITASGSGEDLIPEEDLRSSGSEPYYIQLHSGARFAIVSSDQNGKCKPKKVYEKREIFQRIASEHPDLTDKNSELGKRVKLYFTLQNAGLAGLFAATIIWVFAQAPDPMVSATRITPDIPTEANSQPVDLKNLVFNRPKDDNKHVFFVAASGGGTRAAVYTTSLLAALREREWLDNVVLASGVSGGGMSLAYFAANRERLLSERPESCAGKSERPNPWCDYIDVVSDNHIRNVSRRVGELNIYTNISLGQLLDDSFEVAFSLNKREGYYSNLDELSSMGLILNTSLIAHPLSESNTLLSAFGSEERNNGDENLYRIDAGGRLIFTNIRNINEFPGGRPDNLLLDDQDVRLKYIIGGGPGMPLHSIAALTANFPPVFPNATVRLDKEIFKVTDGGVIENRGLISLLYAIRGLISESSSQQLKQGPVMHVVMAEASAQSIDYENYSTGLAARGSAGAMIGNQLVVELKSQLESMLAKKCGDECSAKLEFHYLNMPLFMRSRRGLGTHWKMPSKVHFHNTNSKKGDGKEILELTGGETICLIQGLFAEDLDKRSAPKIKVKQNRDAAHIQCSSNSEEMQLPVHLMEDNALKSAWGRLNESML